MSLFDSIFNAPVSPSAYDYHKLRQDELMRQLGLAAQQGHMNADTNQICNNAVASRGLQYTSEKEIKDQLLGVLLFGTGEVVPEDWNGGYAERCEKNMFSSGGKSYWRLQMIGAWLHRTIEVYLDTQEYSGTQADALGEVFRETLNQRRSV